MERWIVDEHGVRKRQWLLEEALLLIRSLQPLTRKYNYHLALGGGVLNNGFSRKDLDLYFMPLGNSEPNGEELVKWLDGMWGKHEFIGIGHGYADEDVYKQKLKYDYDGQRIDVFVL